MSYLSEDQIKMALSDHISAFENLVVDCQQDIQRALETIIQTFRMEGKLLIIGNGGSAADAQHIAAELTGRFLIDRKGLPAIACTTDTSVLTSIGNDYGYEILFERQVEALGKAGDSLISISTSGNSINVLRATEYAKSIGISTIGMTGKMGGKLADLVDICIKAPSTSTPRIQEVHGFVGHLLCEGVDEWVAQQKNY